MADRRGRHGDVVGGRSGGVHCHHGSAGRLHPDRVAAAPPPHAEHQRDERDADPGEVRPGDGAQRGAAGRGSVRVVHARGRRRSAFGAHSSCRAHEGLPFPVDLGRAGTDADAALEPVPDRHLRRGAGRCGDDRLSPAAARLLGHRGCRRPGHAVPVRLREERQVRTAGRLDEVARGLRGRGASGVLDVASVRGASHRSGGVARAGA